MQKALLSQHGLPSHIPFSYPFCYAVCITDGGNPFRQNCKVLPSLDNAGL